MQASSRLAPEVRAAKYALVLARFLHPGAKKRVLEEVAVDLLGLFTITGLPVLRKLARAVKDAIVWREKLRAAGAYINALEAEHDAAGKPFWAVTRERRTAYMKALLGDQWPEEPAHRDG